MITAHQLEVRAGARLLMAGVSFRVGAGDKVGLGGRNGAGKTTLPRILAGEGLPAAGRVDTTGAVGYLPQDPRTGDLDVPVPERILSARRLHDGGRRPGRDAGVGGLPAAGPSHRRPRRARTRADPVRARARRRRTPAAGGRDR